MSKLFILTLKAIIFLSLGVFLLVRGDIYFDMPSAVKYLIALQSILFSLLKVVEIIGRVQDKSARERLDQDTEN